MRHTAILADAIGPHLHPVLVQWCSVVQRLERTTRSIAVAPIPHSFYLRTVHNVPTECQWAEGVFNHGINGIHIRIRTLERRCILEIGTHQISRYLLGCLRKVSQADVLESMMIELVAEYLLACTLGNIGILVMRTMLAGIVFLLRLEVTLTIVPIAVFNGNFQAIRQSGEINLHPTVQRLRHLYHPSTVSYLTDFFRPYHFDYPIRLTHLRRDFQIWLFVRYPSFVPVSAIQRFRLHIGQNKMSVHTFSTKLMRIPPTIAGIAVLTRTCFPRCISSYFYHGFPFLQYIEFGLQQWSLMHRFKGMFAVPSGSQPYHQIIHSLADVWSNIISHTIHRLVQL